MKKVTKYGWYLLICVSAITASTSAQNNQEPRQINGGVLNGKAISLPKPPYPPAARSVGASGPVAVQVLIDVNGEVISASAVSGHPLLRGAAVEAARAAKFSPTMLSGVPVKVSGVITYNFVGALQLARIAFLISHAQQTSTFDAYSAPDSLAYQLPSDWHQEKEILMALTFEEQKVEEKKPAVALDDSSDQPRRDTNRYTIKGDINYSAAPISSAGKLDVKSVAALRNLNELIKARAAAHERTAWVFEVGSAIGKLVADAEDGTELQSHCSELESLINRAPAGITEYSLGEMREFVESCQKGIDKPSLIQKAKMLSNLRY